MKHASVFALGIIVSAALAYASLAAQPSSAQSAQTTSAQRLAFEVASVKRNTSGDQGSGISGPRAGSFTSTNVPLDRLVAWAFGVRDDQLIGLPTWTHGERYNVVAKYPNNETPSPDRLQLMVQTLLADRFGVKTHKESREGPTYSLVVARGDGRLGPKLKPITIDCQEYIRSRIAAGQMVMATGRGDAPTCTGVTSNRFIKMSGRPIAILATALAAQVARPVIDKTGLTGNFEINVEWSPNLAAPTPSDSALQTAAVDDGVSLFTALEEQLGLKLEPSRGAVDVLVIDHVERPTAD
jgi:uncharacterized protein (TIGR03435 family)